MTALFDGLIDDAAIFPPGNVPMPEAVRRHAMHRGAWYGRFVGPFVCGNSRLADLAAYVASGRSIAVSVTVPDGSAQAAYAAETVIRTPNLRLAGLEVRLGEQPLAAAILALRGLPGRVFVEIPAAAVNDAAAQALREAGLGLKLRTGGTAASAFPDEPTLAAALQCVVGARLRFKCTAGLHHAVRHRDRRTGFEHHGFLNLALAVYDALSGTDPRPVLAQQDAEAIAGRTNRLTAAERTAIRALFTSFGTCSIDDPITDLTRLGVLRRP